MAPLLGASVVDKGGGKGGFKHGELCSRETWIAVASFVLFAIATGIWFRPENTEWWDDPYSYAPY